MAFIPYNLDEGGRTFEPLPEGEYDVTVQSAELGNSNAGNPKVAIRMVVTGGDFDGKVHVQSFSLMEHARWGLRNFCKAAEIEYGEDGVDEAAFEGGQLTVTIGHRTADNGQTYAGIVRCRRLGSSVRTNGNGLPAVNGGRTTTTAKKPSTAKPTSLPGRPTTTAKGKSTTARR